VVIFFQFARRRLPIAMLDRCGMEGLATLEEIEPLFVESLGSFDGKIGVKEENIPYVDLRSQKLKEWPTRKRDVHEPHLRY
jgi:hypothetical protein